MNSQKLIGRGRADVFWPVCLPNYKRRKLQQELPWYWVKWVGGQKAQFQWQAWTEERKRGDLSTLSSLSFAKSPSFLKHLCMRLQQTTQPFKWTPTNSGCASQRVNLCNIEVKTIDTCLFFTSIQTAKQRFVGHSTLDEVCQRQSQLLHEENVLHTSFLNSQSCDGDVQWSTHSTTHFTGLHSPHRSMQCQDTRTRTHTQNGTGLLTPKERTFQQRDSRVKQKCISVKQLRRTSPPDRILTKSTSCWARRNYCKQYFTEIK